MKILDKYLLKTFLITFTTVFVILFFIFILQTVWLFISELAGKDLDFILVIKFLLFSMPRIIPLVLPLSILLSSIMTFGSLSENYEFAAMKSSGISFQRALQSTSAFILLLSIVSFYFANNVIPYAEYKFINFRRTIAQVKPAMAIAEGQFSEVGNYTIKVDKKSGEKGNILTGVTIHKKLDNGEGNTTVIKAQKGVLVSSESSNTLKLVLTNGNYYEDIIPKKYEDRVKIPFAKGTFKKDIINIDLSKLNQSNMQNVDIANTTTMLNINELRFTLDSLNKNYTKDLHSYTENIYLRTGITNNFYKPSTKETNKPIINLLKNLPDLQKNEILKIATNNIENTNFSIETSIFEMDNKEKNINSHWIALYDKFMIAFSCVLMFFIGAPLGAIIRKGGLGLPIVFAVSIFIVFHFINTFGKRVAQENQMPAFMGVWMSSMLLTPLAILLTYRAINDIGGMISFDGMLQPFQKIFNFKKHLKIKTKENTIQPKRIENLKPAEYPKNSITEYVQSIKILFLLYLTNSLFFVLLIKTNNLLSGIMFFISLIIFLYLVNKSQNKIKEIQLKSQLLFEPGILISLLVAFPFYPIIYFYNKKMLSEILVQKK